MPDYSIALHSDDALVTDRLFNAQTLNEISNHHTKLTENSCPDSVVDIGGLPDDARIIIIAGFPETCRYFKGEGIASRGDFSIIVPSMKQIIHLELKRTQKSISSIRIQLLGSAALVGYFKALAEKQLNERHYLDGYSEKFVAIGYTSVDMRSSGSRKCSGSGDSPDDIRRIYYPGKLQFKSLL